MYLSVIIGYKLERDCITTERTSEGDEIKQPRVSKICANDRNFETELQAQAEDLKTMIIPEKEISYPANFVPMRIMR